VHRNLLSRKKEREVFISVTLIIIKKMTARAVLTFIVCFLPAWKTTSFIHDVPWRTSQTKAH